MLHTTLIFNFVIWSWKSRYYFQLHKVNHDPISSALLRVIFHWFQAGNCVSNASLECVKHILVRLHLHLPHLIKFTDVFCCEKSVLKGLIIFSEHTRVSLIIWHNKNRKVNLASLKSRAGKGAFHANVTRHHASRTKTPFVCYGTLYTRVLTYRSNKTYTLLPPPIKRESLGQCWFNVGRRRRRPTLNQHWPRELRTELLASNKCKLLYVLKTMYIF